MSQIITETAIAYVMSNESILLEDRLEYLKQNTKTLSTDHDQLLTVMLAYLCLNF